jgi:hypothetical protein
MLCLSVLAAMASALYNCLVGVRTCPNLTATAADPNNATDPVHNYMVRSSCIVIAVRNCMARSSLQCTCAWGCFPDPNGVASPRPRESVCLSMASPRHDAIVSPLLFD